MLYFRLLLRSFIFAAIRFTQHDTGRAPKPFYDLYISVSSACPAIVPQGRRRMPSEAKICIFFKKTALSLRVKNLC